MSVLPMALAVPAIVVAGSVFAAAVLSTGQLSTAQFQQVALSAVRDTSTGIVVDGPIVARTDGTSVTQIMIDITTFPGGLPVNLDPAAISERTVVSYIDEANLKHDVPYSVTWIIGNGNAQLESGERAEVVVDLTGIVQSGDSFTLEVRPAHGIGVTVQRAMPSGGGHLPTILELW